MDDNDLKRIQDTIGGYEFKNIDLLQQAFVRRSYSAENGGQNNEVLEFIGDKVLDYYVVRMLTRKCGSITDNEEFKEFKSSLTEGELTEEKRILVEKKMLAQRIDELDLSQYLILGKGDNEEEIYNKASVKEDLFEAILGAVAIDSNWNSNVLEDTVETMLDPDSAIDLNDDENYVAKVQEWTLVKYGDIPWFHYDKYSPYNCINPTLVNGISLGIPNITDEMQHGINDVICMAKLGDYKNTFWTRSKSKKDARKKLCKEIYLYLDKHGLLLSIADEIDNPNKEDSISQLEILSRRGYFELPKYAFNSSYDKNGNPVWECTCSISEKNIKTSSKSSSKKEAKKEAAFKALIKAINNKKENN